MFRKYFPVPSKLRSHQLQERVPIVSHTIFLIFASASLLISPLSVHLLRLSASARVALRFMQRLLTWSFPVSDQMHAWGDPDPECHDSWRTRLQLHHHWYYRIPSRLRELHCCKRMRKCSLSFTLTMWLNHMAQQDLMLFDLFAALQDAGIISPVKTGSRLF